MDKTVLSLLIAAATLVGPSSIARAEPPREMRVAVIAAEGAAFNAASEGFSRAIEQRGIVLRATRFAPADARAAVDSGAAIILALGSAAAGSAIEIPAVTPIVYAVVGDPAASGLTTARVRARAMIGVAALAPARAQLELLAAIAPDAKRIGLVASKSGSRAIVEDMSVQAARLGIQLVPITPSNANELGVTLAARAGEFDAIVAVADAALWNGNSVKAAVIFSIQKKKPLFGFSSSFTRAGAVASVSAEDYADMGAQAAMRALALWEGKSAGQNIFAESPRKLSTSINLVVAQRIGLDPPRELLDRADVVFR